MNRLNKAAKKATRNWTFPEKSKSKRQSQTDSWVTVLQLWLVPASVSELTAKIQLSSCCGPVGKLWFLVSTQSTVYFPCEQTNHWVKAQAITKWICHSLKIEWKVQFSPPSKTVDIPLLFSITQLIFLLFQTWIISVVSLGSGELVTELTQSSFWWMTCLTSLKSYLMKWGNRKVKVMY